MSDDAADPQAGPDPEGEVRYITVYEAVGGDGYFEALVEDFYQRVAADELLAPSYPEDLTRSKRDLAQFLSQFWGGPTTYSDAKGHPRLRMRHAPFVIGMAERDAWLTHMRAAVAATNPPAEVHQMLDQYFEQASLAMMNQSS